MKPLAHLIFLFVFLNLPQFSQALPESQETEKNLHEHIIKNFLQIANDPNLYIQEQILQFKKEHQNDQNPDGGISNPVKKEHLQSLTLASIWDHHEYCMDNGECVQESYKRILLIGIPTKICTAKACTTENILFRMKGGLKTTCLKNDKSKCIDSSILYLPEEIELSAK
jgi:hypothetical protein